MTTVVITALTLRKALQSALLPQQEIENAQQLLSQLQTAPGVYNISRIASSVSISLHLEPCISSVMMAEMLLKHIPAETLDRPINVDDGEIVSEIAATTNRLRHAVEASRL